MEVISTERMAFTAMSDEKSHEVYVRRLFARRCEKSRRDFSSFCPAGTNLCRNDFRRL